MHILIYSYLCTKTPPSQKPRLLNQSISIYAYTNILLLKVPLRNQRNPRPFVSIHLITSPSFRQRAENQQAINDGQTAENKSFAVAKPREKILSKTNRCLIPLCEFRALRAVCGKIFLCQFVVHYICVIWEICG